MKTVEELLARIGSSKALSFLVSILLAFPCTALVGVAFYELMPFLYMYSNDVDTRSELSEDLGFGMVMFFGGLGITALAFPSFTGLAYAIMRRNSHPRISENISENN